MIVNQISSSNSDDLSYGFDPAKGAHLFGEEETCFWNINLVSAAEWNAHYFSFSEKFPGYTDEQLLELFKDEEVVQKYKTALNLLTARGYN